MLNNAHIHPKCFTSYIIKKKSKLANKKWLGWFICLIRSI